MKKKSPESPVRSPQSKYHIIPRRGRRVFGDQERVLVDGEPGTVVDSPTRDSYIVQLDTGECVSRMESTITQIETEGE